MSAVDSTCLLPLVGRYGEGKFSLLDPDVFFWAKNFTWFCAVNGYVVTRTGGRSIALHRILMDNPQSAGGGRGMDVDHVNRDKLDNRRANLRVVTRQQNIRNNGPRKVAASKYKGVTFNARGRRWAARITVGGKAPHLGLFDSEEAAALAYDEAAREVFREHAYLNFPERREQCLGPKARKRLGL